MPTIRQKNLAKEIIKNTKRKKPLNKGELLEKVGYAQNTLVKKPTEVIQARGVKEALKEYGLTEELVTTSLVSDIQEKPKNRLGELRLASEILGMNEGEKGNNKTLVLIVSGESASRFNVQPTRIPEASSD